MVTVHFQCPVKRAGEGTEQLQIFTKSIKHKLYKILQKEILYTIYVYKTTNNQKKYLIFYDFHKSKCEKMTTYH